MITPTPTSMSTQDHDTSSTWDDSALWNDEDNLQPDEQTSTWIFRKEQPGIGLLLMCGSDQGEYTIHIRAIRIISFLEVYCIANRSSSPTPDSNRLGHYLRRLRESVSLELQSTPRERLLDTMWQPLSLKQWAMRVRQGYNHSPQARALYQIHCAQKGWRPYQHDNPLYYGRL